MERFGLETKEYMADELKARFKKNPDVFITTFSNLNVPELQELRSSLKNTSSGYMVVKNSIVHRVIKELKIKEIATMINGTCGIVFVGEDPIAVSKALANFKKAHDTLEIKGGLLEGAAVSSEKIKELSTLPPKEILLKMVVSGIYAPVTGFVNSLAGLIRKFVYAINAIKEKGKNMNNADKRR